MDRDSNIKNVIEKLDGFYESLSKGERMKFDISYLRKANVYLADLKNENETLVKQLCEKEDMIREAEGRFYELEKELDTLKNAKKPEPEWISVEDRLPEPLTSVLAYDYKNKRVGLFCFKNPENMVSFYSHWMPLPEPPKPKEPTFMDVFLKAFPKASFSDVSCCMVFTEQFVYDSCDCNCNACWNQPYIETEEEGEADA